MTITTTNASMTIRFSGAEQLWALCKTFEVPKQDIKRITWHQQYHNQTSLWRVAGTGMPGVLFAGYFRRAKKWEFLYIRKPRGLSHFRAPHVLVIELKGSKFDRILLTASKETAERLTIWHTS